MAGHNKWSKIKHRKAVVDKRRGKVWTKVAKAIIVAAKNGGPDPASNLSLRYAIDEARYANMPRDTIERAIKKGTGAGAGENYEPTRYEGYGPGGAAIIVDALTDNRTRTVGDVRLAFSNHEGNLGNTGCVAYMFDSRGQIVAKAAGLSEDRVLELAIDAGAADVESPDDPSDNDAAFVILTPVDGFQRVKDAIEHAGLTIIEARIAMIPQNKVEVRGDAAKNLLDLVDALEDLDDVQNVYSNFTIPDDEAESLSR
ncbi:MAG: YebC/PmpR family DNA-binding transcriptional regulator [Phycisphaerales bacterium]|nr:YebC/PmpR family DNA-binding transcriptional regulator [Phycisphaerales bacterium]